MLACGDVPVHDVLYHVPQAGPHHGGRPVARAVNLHEYAALRVAAAENIFQAAENIFLSLTTCRISCGPGTRTGPPCTGS